MMYSKSFKKTLILGVVTACILLFSIVSAQSTGLLDMLYNKIQQRRQTCDLNLEQKRASIEESLKNKMTENDTDLAQKRAVWDSKKEEYYKKLRASAKTEQQKQAVERFIAAADLAIKTRKEAVDAAIAAFRQAAQEALNSREAANDKAISDFISTCEAVYQDAREKVLGGQILLNLLTPIKDDLRAARDKFTQDSGTVSGTRSLIQSAIDQRNSALDAAKAQFKDSLNQALKDLKAAL